MADSVSAFDGGSLMNCLSLHRASACSRRPAARPACRRYSARPRVSWMCAFCTATRARRCCSQPTPRSSRTSAPAHIFQRRIRGAGSSYRQCFDGAALNFRQYDRALSEVSPSGMISLSPPGSRCGGSPRPLLCRTAHARTDLAVLREHGGPLACALAKQGDSVPLHLLLSLSVLSDAGIDAAGTAAREAGQTAALSVLLAAAAGPSKPRGRAKTFDL